MKRLIVLALMIFGLSLVAAPVLAARNSVVGTTKLTFIVGKVYIAGQTMPEGKNVTAGVIVAAMPDNWVLIQDNAGNLWRAEAPDGWTADQGKKIVMFSTSSIDISGEEIGHPVVIGAIKWFDAASMNQFKDKLGIVQNVPQTQPDSMSNS